jgi:carboxypeptidase C (cathepsin A)
MTTHRLAGALPLLITALLAFTPAPARAQGRAAQTTPAPPASATAPAQPQAPPGGRGRGGVAGPGPAVGGEIDETPVLTHHSITLDGKPLNYTATAAQMPLKDPAGETEAHIFYMAYTLDGVSDPSKRPLTFCFNGGPGSASMWVHMGGMGPRSPRLLPTGSMPPPPYQLKDNPDTWLDKTDLVFIDPVGTGYSRAKTVEIARRMNSVQGDIQSVGEFMRMYITRNSREVSPLFIAGESYGTFRAAGLAGYLIDHGIAFNGIVLIGTTLDLETIWSRDDLVHQLELPTYCADAYYHKKVAADLQKKDLKTFLKEAEAFAMGEYAAALAKGDELPAAERKAVIEKLARYTGLDARYLDETNLRWDVSHFTRQLLRDRERTIGRYDGRLTGPSGMNTGETSEFDPSSTLITPPFTAMFTTYIRNELGYKTDMYYYPSGGIQPWDYGVQNGFGDTTSLLRNAMVKNPYLKVMIAAGYFDLATPYFAVEYTFNHMGLDAEMHRNIAWDFYQSGHMLYIDSDSHTKLKHDFSEFLSSALPKDGQ